MLSRLSLQVAAMTADCYAVHATQSIGQQTLRVGLIPPPAILTVRTPLLRWTTHGVVGALTLLGSQDDQYFDRPDNAPSFCQHDETHW